MNWVGRTCVYRPHMRIAEARALKVCLDEQMPAEVGDGGVLGRRGTEVSYVRDSCHPRRVDGRLALDKHPYVVTADQEYPVDAREGRLDRIQPVRLRVVQIDTACLDPAPPGGQLHRTQADSTRKPAASGQPSNAPSRQSRTCGCCPRACNSVQERPIYAEV